MQAKELLKQSKLNPRDSQIILSHILKITRERLLSHPEIDLKNKDIKEFKKLEKKRLKLWPLAYLIASQAFYSLGFKVNQHTLIPRPESELIIDEIIEDIKKQNKETIQRKTYNFIDIGTGSSAIITSLAKVISKKYPEIFKSSSFIGLDISRKALKVAKHNIRQHGLADKVELIKSNLIKKLNTNNLNGLPILIANLPYLDKEQLREASIKHEPKKALYGGGEGLSLYKVLFKMIEPKALNSFSLICEINPEQKDRLISLAKSYFKATVAIKVIQDLAHKDRFIKITRNN